MASSVRDVHALANQLGTIMSVADECRVMDLLMRIPAEDIARDIDGLFLFLGDLDISRSGSIYGYQPGTSYLATTQEFGAFLLELARSSLALSTDEREELIEYAENLSDGYDEDVYFGRASRKYP